MNDILYIKGPFEHRNNPNRPGSPKLASGAKVTSKHLKKLENDLIKMLHFWSSQKLLGGALVSVYYNKVAAKSNRISGFLKYNGKPVNDSIVGAKFPKDSFRHIITHYVSIESLVQTIDYVNKSIEILEDVFNGELTHIVFNNKDNIDSIQFTKYKIYKTHFQNIIVDASYVEKFDVEQSPIDETKRSIITMYKTDPNIDRILVKLGISIEKSRILDDTTVLMNQNEIELLMLKAPFLVSMAVEDLSSFDPEDFSILDEFRSITIPHPKNEPVIGVIDTLFDKSVYFTDWVEYHQMVDDDFDIKPRDYTHGTSVTSIIVDGPTLNPNLDDGCGRFKVRHFGVSLSGRFSSFTIIKRIKEIVVANPDIKVWNLSLGSNEEVNRNFISIEASILDQLQFDNDVIFVVSGTNDFLKTKNKIIGSPADSINALVVNSVDKSLEPTNYSRKGPVLSFFTKPDVSYYGGSSKEPMVVCDPNGEALVSGTSYAAPWISRKLAYLIDVLGFNREIAKAILIDSAIGWKEIDTYNRRLFIGHGVVPIRIEDIVKSQEDEIKFVLYGVSEKFDTYNYNFPIPYYKDEYPFVAKATLCYFPKCSRNQGVDYTNTELDIYFGRIQDNNTIKSIDNNKQSIEDGGFHPVNEEEARSNYRKWDNIKHVQEKYTSNVRPRKTYSTKLWGMSIRTKERLNPRDGVGIRFGIVVTLKEINGLNRIEDFIQQFSFRGWLVNRINVENRIEIHQKANEDIDFR